MRQLAALAALRDPTPKGPDTPSALAVQCSRGAWRRAAHLDAIEQACLAPISAVATNPAARSGTTISASVRHGKSEYASKWLIAWYLGRHPDNRVILAASTAQLARKWGRQVRDILTEWGPAIFGVRPDPKSRAANRWDIEGRAGGMFTLGVGGTVTGEGANLIVVDDPYRNFADAMSPTVRRNVREWWTGTMETRREPGTAIIIICARWHEEDLTGFLLGANPDEWRDVHLPALCIDPAADLLGRQEGEALWPERFSRDALLKAKTAVSLELGSQIWDAQYQQVPSAPGGDVFPNDDRWGTLTRAPFDDHDIRWCRAWDLAATAGGGDYTAGVLIGQSADYGTIVADVVRGQWSSDEMRRRIIDTANTDPHGTIVRLPQDPGQAGKDQATQMVRALAGHDVRARPVSGSKEVRATGFAAQQQAGNVRLVAAAWNGPFCAELAAFPRGAHDDQVDAAADAFNELHSGPAKIHEIGHADPGAVLSATR